MRILIVAFALAAAGSYAQTTTAELRTAIVSTALALKGVPYVYGAESPPEALDCSGLVQYVYRKAADLKIPRNSRQQWAAGRPVATSRAEPGDVFVFDTSGSGPSHVALYLGDGSIIQAVSEGPQTGVIVSSMSERYWATAFMGARSFLSEPSGAATSGSTAPAVAAAAQAAGAATPPAAAQATVQPGVAAASPASPSGAAPERLKPEPSLGQAERGAAVPAAGPADSVPVSEIGFELGARPSVVTDRIPTAVGSMLAFTITNRSGAKGKFLIDFYKDNVDFRKIVPIKHAEVSIDSGGHYRLEPVLFDEPGRYRLNVKTAGNTQLMQRSFEVVSIGKGGAIQAFTGQAAPAAALPAGTPIVKAGLIVGSEPPERGGSIRAALGSAILLRVANGTPIERDLEFLLYRIAESGEGNLVLADERAHLPPGGWIELSPVLLPEAGAYRFVVKSSGNDLLLERTILVDAAP